MGIKMLETLFKLILCHLVGDYVLQIDYIAKTKGGNIYHLLVHCFLYTLPFYMVFGFTWHLIPLLVLHIVIDLLKARYKIIPYWVDQVLHYLTTLLY
jgi:hypothetical protein